MKSWLRHYGPVALMLAAILLVTSCLSLLTGREVTKDRPLVLVTTYPLYVAAQNVLGDTDAVRLEMLSGVGTGCLHDYQLSPADRLLLAQADLVLCNGAGAEPFLDGLVEESRRVDTSVGVELICSDHHHDHHEEEHHASYNEHLWVSPACYLQQVDRLCGALIHLRVLDVERCVANKVTYLKKIHAVAAQMPAAELKGRPCVLFHDSLAYLARELNLDVKLTVSYNGDSGMAAADLAAVERLAKEHPDLLLLYDTQYPIRYGGVDRLVPAGQVLALETAVSGTGKASDWLKAMERNAQKLQKLVGGDAP